MEPQASQTNSSDYFEDEDSQFLEALGTAVLPGDLPNEPDPEEEESQELALPPPYQPSLKRRYSHTSLDEEKNDSEQNVVVNDSDTYGASRFGGFGDYMKRKRAKLQIQNSELEQPSANDDVPKSQIFKGIAIYVSPLLREVDKLTLTFESKQINGWTQPSVQVLRQLIVQNGGVFQPYLDKKALVYVFGIPFLKASSLTIYVKNTYRHLLSYACKNARVQADEGRSSRMAPRKCRRRISLTMEKLYLCSQRRH